MKNLKMLLMPILGIIATFVIVQTQMVNKLVIKSENVIQTAVEKPINPGIVESFGLNTQVFAAADSKEFYQNWLNNEEVKIWNNFKLMFNITKQESDALKIEWQKEYVQLVEKMNREELATAPLITEDNKKLVETVLQEFGIDPATVSIINWNKNSLGGSTDKSIYINQKFMLNMPIKVKKHVIGHEIGHMLNKDHSTCFVIAQLRAIYKIEDSPEVTKALQDFTYFKELRADITALMQGKDYVEGAIMSMEHDLEAATAAKVVQKESLSHPSDRLRCDIAQNFLKVVTV